MLPFFGASRGHRPDAAPIMVRSLNGPQVMKKADGMFRVGTARSVGICGISATRSVHRYSGGGMRHGGPTVVGPVCICRGAPPAIIGITRINRRVEPWVTS